MITFLPSIKLKEGRSGKPMPKATLGVISRSPSPVCHRRIAKGLTVDYGFPGKDTVFLGKLSFALGRLGSGASSTFAPLGYDV